jgi:short-subunit dehydrogenase
LAKENLTEIRIMNAASRSRTASLPIKLGLVGAACVSAAYLLRQNRRIDFRGKTVAITGGSRGLGLELARGFAAEGANIVLLARDRRQLSEAENDIKAAGVQVTALSCDVADRAQVRQTMDRIIGEFGVDVLINNAGIIQVGPYEQMEVKDFADAMDTHFWGPLHIIQAVVDHMKHKGGGRIVNITSIGGKIALPHLVPYVASKFALVGLSEALRTELLKDRIYVTTVVPGLMRTGSHVNALFKGQHEKEFALFSIANACPILSISSEFAARQIIEACRYGVAEVVLGSQARFGRLLNVTFPNVVAAMLSVAARFLPAPSGSEGNRLRRGWQSRSALAPALLTRPADRVVRRNLENFQPPPMEQN